MLLFNIKGASFNQQKPQKEKETQTPPTTELSE